MECNCLLLITDVTFEHYLLKLGKFSIAFNNELFMLPFPKWCLTKFCQFKTTCASSKMILLSFNINNKAQNLLVCALQEVLCKISVNFGFILGFMYFFHIFILILIMS